MLFSIRPCQRFGLPFARINTFCALALSPAMRPPIKFAHDDKPIGVTVRVSGAGGRYPSALCGRSLLE
jgi:hypothetical protein